MFCPECGTQVQPGDPFCGECGGRQEPAPLAPPPVVVEARKGRGENRMPDVKKPKKATANIQLDPGTLLVDRYAISNRVGGGGMGSVYRARDKRLADRLCAVKEMIELFADESQRAKAVEDFRREAAVLARLKHPSIPTIYDNFIEGGRYYLVMEWIGGGDLAEQMRAHGGIVEEATVAKWAAQICDVLYYIHTQNPPIIYRDLKPANLMLDDNTGRVMLVDFGIARIVQSTEKGVTAIGTMGYAPPELFAGKVEPRSDVYSLGATMFHMLTGSDPQDNPLLIFDFSKHPRPSQINPAISVEMERILMKTVAHKPEDRPASALELKKSLEDHLQRLEAKGVVPQPSRPPFVAPVQPASGAVSPTPSAPREVRPKATPPSSPPAVSAQSPAGGSAAVEWVFCGHCGDKIGAGDVYCAHCGSRQPVLGSAGHPGSARVTAQLVVVGTSDMVKPFPLNQDSLLIGRTDPHTGIFPEIDLTLYDPETKVSRRHAMIYRQGEQFLIEDLGSVNGTIVNTVSGGQIKLNTKAPRVLSAGDELKLGGTVLKFVTV
ncbi:MAG TPA: protein kinase [Blastocatellia bacterium]|nr:protein kinase [Blastocatellia bacterium]